MAKTDDGGQVEAARHDSRVRSPASRIGDESEHPLRVEVCRHRGKQVVGDDDRPLRDLVEIVGLRSGENLNQALRDIGDVTAPFAQVVVRDLGIEGQQLRRHVPDGPLGVGVVLPDEGLDLSRNSLILQQKKVSFQDIGTVDAQRGPHPLDGSLDLLLGDLERLVKALDLAIEQLVRQEGPDDPPAGIVDQKRTADRDPLADANPLEAVLAQFVAQITHP